MSGLTESHVSSENNPVGSFVEATLNYFAEASEKPVIYTCEPSPGVPRTTGKSEAHLVLIQNGRLAEELSLDRQGFQLVHQESAVRDFYDRAEVERVYYPEIEVLLKETTGAEKVVVFDHQVRNIELSKQGERDARECVRTVHSDYTAKSGPRRVKDHLPAEGAEERLRHRFAEINVWRPIRGTDQIHAAGGMRCAIDRSQGLCSDRFGLPGQSWRGLSFYLQPAASLVLLPASRA